MQACSYTPPSDTPTITSIMAAADVPFRTEYAKSNRSSCKLCRNTIDKDNLRMAKMVQSPKFDGKIPNWYHYSCFFRVAKPTSIDDIGGMGGIRWDDQQKIKEKIEGSTKGGASESTDGPSTATTGSKRKKGQKTEGTKKPRTDVDPLEQELKEQTELIWNCRDQLYANLTNGQLKDMLEANGQTVVKSSESKLLDSCSDGMVFGALSPCDTCGGQLVARTHHYSCTGNISDWTKCTETNTTAKRKRWTVPSYLKDAFPFLKKYKYEERVRVFPKAPASSSSTSLEGSNVTPTQSEEDPSQPLKGFSIRIIGKLGTTQKEIAAEIKKLGGSVASKTTPTTTLCISNSAEIDKKGQSMEDVRRCNVPVVDLDYLSDVAKGGNALGKITTHTISSWGGARDKLPSAATVDQSSLYEKAGSTVKMTVKGGAIVDADSGLESTHHVLDTPPGTLYTAVLGMVDVIRGTNSYYKLQVLESDSGKNYRVFRSWGRVGTTIGGSKTENFYSDMDDAIEEFRRLYFEKTGNSWANRKSFNKVAGKFYPLEMDYGQDEDTDSKMDLASAGSKSKLAPEIQELVKMMFDIESMKKALIEFEIDTKKMPLGKLSKRQIEKAYTVLSNLLAEIKGSNNPAKILDGSNQFYTLIPHDFGMQKPPLLDNEKAITTKTLMLDNLLEIEFAYSVLKSSEGNADEKDPLDVHFEKLATDMNVVSKSLTEFTDIVEYVKNTHGATHTQYSLDVMELFKISRHGERKRFKPFSKNENRMLLWHGSRLTNFVGILSQGLRIAPPEAPVTGYMFGKGVYFADMVTKSANYCWTSRSNPIGLMLLCEVALGEMYERTSAEFVTKLPDDKSSTKGVGRTTPDPAGFKVTDTGAVIPAGKGCPSSKQHSSLLYNEYIVYDVAQINMKYLVKMNFKYK